MNNTVTGNETETAIKKYKKTPNLLELLLNSIRTLGKTSHQYSSESVMKFKVRMYHCDKFKVKRYSQNHS